MRDSWIDKKELEELVGEFSSTRGKSRRRGPASGRKEESDASTHTAGDALVDLAAAALSEVSPKIPVAQVPRETGASFDDLVLPDGEGPGSPDTRSMAGGDGEGHKAEFNLFHDSAPFDPDDAGVEFGLFELDDETDDIFGAMEAGSDAVPPVGGSVDPEFAETSPGGDGIVANLTIEPASSEAGHSRKIPSFLGGTSDLSEAEAPQMPLYARDADRAITALAEARAKVDESRLLRSLDQSEKDILPNPEDQSEAEAAGYLHARLEHFGEAVQRELGALEVAVCDADGLLLYQSSGFEIDKALHQSLMLQVTGKMGTLLGLGKEGVSQLTDGSGFWRCLISGNGGNGNLFAGFTLRKPLEEQALEKWKAALLVTTSLNRSNR